MIVKIKKLEISFKIFVYLFCFKKWEDFGIVKVGLLYIIVLYRNKLIFDIY